MRIVATDTGGTFTDLAAFDAQAGTVVYSKSLTTYGDFVKGVISAAEVARVDLAPAGLFKHGTTLVINALIQRTGAKTALVMTRGFRDVLEIGRGNRPEPFNLNYSRHATLVPRELRFEVAERTSGTGEPLLAPNLDDLDVLADRLRGEGVEAVAVSFLNAYLQPRHEEQVVARLRERLPGVFVTCGSELSREWYEYERTATCAANAYVGPQVTGYLHVLREQLGAHGFAGRIFLMGSNGGVLGLEEAGRGPLALVESGPVGGCIGAAAYAGALGLGKVIAFDMGGTTAKCAVVEDGAFDVKSVYHVGGYERGFPIRGAVLDIVEVGAGGGSIAHVDGQGGLRVGPRSAGSTPGPAAYGRGGTEPTITDANLILGRIDAASFLGGTMKLDPALAHHAMQARVAVALGYEGADGLDRLADGIVSIAAVTMAGAIKKVTVEKGLDPRDYVLFAFGGGGPLHAVELARQLSIPEVIVPPEPGNFSALGMLLSDYRVDRSSTFVREFNEANIASALELSDSLKQGITEEIRAESSTAAIEYQHYFEIRYRGQVHSIRTQVGPEVTADALRSLFEQLYRRRYGHADARAALELVSVTTVGLGTMDKPDLGSLARFEGSDRSASPSKRSVYFPGAGRLETAVHARRLLPRGFAAHGPALVEEYGSTTLVGPGDRFEVGVLGELRIRLAAREGGQ
ncbi:MAG: hydantoinase/oxoprolinase family protein [bacterium]|jgi:N-methylhydantoinase A|nr:hydantoinase/oxoprolinase family protein [Betaproteobacteria bacterium]